MPDSHAHRPRPKHRASPRACPPTGPALWRGLVLAWLALGLAGCGGGGGGVTPTASDPPTGAPAPAPAPSPAPVPASPTRLIVVGSSAALPSGAESVARLVDVPWATLPAGAEVQLAAGNHAGPVTISAVGSAARPILIRPMDGVTATVQGGSLDFQGAAWVTVQGLVIQDSPWGAVVIRRGSHHVTVQGNTLRRSAMGIDVSDGAGVGLQLLGNLIEDQQTHGIAIIQVNGDPASPSVVSGNTIRRSGHHGLELQGSNHLIERNDVSENGLSLAGTSGIHLYSSAEDAYCDDNEVRYNRSYNNHDRTAYDGNGIQVDHWCDRNRVHHNLAWGNDGAGIAVFDARDNQVFNNTLMGNGLDPKRSVDQRGEIVLNSAGSQRDRTTGNQVFNNLLLPSLPTVSGLLVDYTTADNANLLGPNMHAPRSDGGALLRQGGRVARSASELLGVTGVSGHLVESPVMADAAAPGGGGWRLIRTPALSGRWPGDDQADWLGVLPLSGMSFFGAYYTAAGLP